MTGKSIVTQNVTTFIKNSANFENILPGVVAFGDFRKASFFISASYTSSQPLTLQSCFARSFLFPSSRKHARMLSREMTMQTDQPRCHMPRAPKTTPTSRGASGIPISPAPPARPVMIGRRSSSKISGRME